MATVRFEPLALQIQKLISLERLLEAGRSREPGPDARDASMPADVREFLSCYTWVVATAWQLLGAPQFERLSQLYDRLEEEFCPGGPPMSPVYDSYASQHILGQVPQGVANETPYTVLARITLGQPGCEPLQAMARALADSHLDLYRVTAADGLSAELERVRSEGALRVRLTGPFLRAGDRMLARVMAFRGGLFIADSPYLLRASEAEWCEYLARVSTPPRDVAKAGAPAPAHSNPKLSPKQRARLRQQKAAASLSAPEAAVVRHLKHGRSERYWLDYIMAGYAGERRGIVYLAGVPDRPETLPHHAEYDPSTAPALAGGSDEPASGAGNLDTLPALRAVLVEIAEREGIPGSSPSAT